MRIDLHVMGMSRSRSAAANVGQGWSGNNVRQRDEFSDVSHGRGSGAAMLVRLVGTMTDASAPRWVASCCAISRRLGCGVFAVIALAAVEDQIGGHVQ